MIDIIIIQKYTPTNYFLEKIFYNYTKFKVVFEQYCSVQNIDYITYLATILVFAEKILRLH